MSDPVAVLSTSPPVDGRDPAASDLDFAGWIEAIERGDLHFGDRSAAVPAVDAFALDLAAQLFAAQADPPAALARRRWAEPIAALAATVTVAVADDPVTDLPREAGRLTRWGERWQAWLAANGLGRVLPNRALSHRRLAEGATLALLLALAVLVYRLGPESAARNPDGQTTGEDWIAAFHNRVWPPERPAGLATHPDRGSALVLMDQVGGETFAQARDGRYLFFGRGRRLVGYDLTQAKWPESIGDSRLFDAAPIAIAVRHGYAYVALAGETSLHVLAVPDPRAIKANDDTGRPPEPFEELGTVDLEGWPIAIANDAAPPGSETMLYMLEGRGNPMRSTRYLTVLDIANPRAPRRIASSALGVEQVDVALHPGDPRYLYVAERFAGTGGVRVLDVTDPARPRDLGRVPGVEDTESISIGDDKRGYLISRNEGGGAPAAIHQLDLTDPRAPRLVDLDFGVMPSAAGGPWSPDRMPRFGVLFANSEPFSEPTSFGLALSDGRLAETLADGLGNMGRPDVSVALASLEVYSDRMYAISDLAKHGSTLWNLQRPHGEMAFKAAETFDRNDPPAGMAVDRNFIFGIAGGDIRWYNLGVLGTPAFLAPDTTPAFARGRQALWSLSLSFRDSLGFEDPTMSYAPYPPPRRVARVAFEAPPSIAVDGDFGVALHTAPVLGDIGFTVVGLVDVLNLNTMSGPDASILGKLELTAPARPADDRKLVEGETGHSGPGGHEFEPWGVALKGHYAYVTTQDSLRVIDIFKVDDVGGLGGLGAAGGIVVTGGHAYVADRLGGLRVIDITRPAMPRLVETLPPGDAIGVAAFDGGLAVLDASGGLSLFRIERPGQLELVSRIEPSNINTVSTHATHIAASGHSVFLAGPGFVWATSTDAPTNSTYFEDFDFLSNIQSIAAVDGLLYVNDRRSGMLVFDHVTAPYWAMVAITVHEPPDRGAATATPPPAADASSGGDAADAAATDGSETTEDDLGYISGPITSFKIGSDEDAYRSVWLDGPAEALARLGRTVFLEPVDVTRGERIFRFAGRRAMLLPPGVRPVDGPDDAEVEVEFNWAPNDKEQAAFATEIAGTVPTRTPIPGLPRPRPTATPPPIVVPDFSTLRGP